ncbi:hypothetical protein ACI79C_14150 [Geodermatophilus sp. SYSU D00697]
MTDRPPLAELVDAVTDAVPAEDGEPVPLVVESLAVQTPVELEIHVRDGRVIRVAATPPTQTVETSVLPVWHSLTVRMVAS